MNLATWVFALLVLAEVMLLVEAMEAAALRILLEHYDNDPVIAVLKAFCTSTFIYCMAMFIVLLVLALRVPIQ